jgi:cytochrome c peroxidase
MTMRRIRSLAIGTGAAAFAAYLLLGGGGTPTQAGGQQVELTDIELLGKYVFFDKISVPERMACATCHDPKTGWTGGVSGVNLHQVAITGADPHTAGALKPPTNAYASLISPAQPCPFGIPGFCGGNFWDGRSEGNETPLHTPATEHIGDEVFGGDGNLQAAYGRYLGPVADQALNPFPNPVEQNIEREGVCRHVEGASYAALFESVWGEPIDCDAQVDLSFKRIAVALSAYQASPDVNSFSSKRDIALQRERNGIDNDSTPGEFPLVGLTDQENYGHDLFYATFLTPILVDSVRKVSNCSFCHSDVPPLPGPPAPGNDFDTGAELDQAYADDGYHNIGTPPNPEIPDTGVDPDLGLGGRSIPLPPLPPLLSDFNGFHKTPTLRNVDKRPGKGFVKAYTHNGWFKSLESLVHFYNTAHVAGQTAATFGVTRCPADVTTEKDALKHNCWPAPAYPTPAIPFLLGDLGLTREDEAALVAYMKTLTDLHTAKQPPPYKRRR